MSSLSSAPGGLMWCRLCLVDAEAPEHLLQPATHLSPLYTLLFDSFITNYNSFAVRWFVMTYSKLSYRNVHKGQYKLLVTTWCYSYHLLGKIQNTGTDPGPQNTYCVFYSDLYFAYVIYRGSTKNVTTAYF